MFFVGQFCSNQLKRNDDITTFEALPIKNVQDFRRIFILCFDTLVMCGFFLWNTGEGSCAGCDVYLPSQ